MGNRRNVSERRKRKKKKKSAPRPFFEWDSKLGGYKINSPKEGGDNV